MATSDGVQFNQETQSIEELFSAAEEFETLLQLREQEQEEITRIFINKTKEEILELSRKNELTLCEEIKDASKKIEEKQREIQQLQKQLDSGCTKEQKEHLLKQLQLKKSEVTHLQEIKRTMEARIGKFQSVINLLEPVSCISDEIRPPLDLLFQQQAQLKLETEEFQRQLQAVKSVEGVSVGNNTDWTIQMVEDERLSWQKKEQTIEMEKQDLRNQIGVLNEKIVMLEQAFARQDPTVNQIKEMLEADQHYTSKELLTRNMVIQDLENQLRNLKEENNRLSKDMECQETKFKTLDQTSKGEEARLRSELQAITRQETEINILYQARKDEHEKVRSELQTTKHQETEVNKLYQASKDDNEKLRLELQLIKRQETENKKLYQASKDEHEKMRTELQTTKRQETEVNTLYQTSKNENEKLRSELQTIKRQETEVNILYQTSKNENERLRSELQTIKRQINQLENSLDESSRKNEKLRSKLQKARRQQVEAEDMLEKMEDEMEEGVDRRVNRNN